MGPLTVRAKLTVTLEMVQADMQLGAGSGEPAGAVQTVALVVMRAYLGVGWWWGVTIVLQQKYIIQRFTSQEILKSPLCLSLVPE